MNMKGKYSFLLRFISLLRRLCIPLMHRNFSKFYLGVYLDQDINWNLRLTLRETAINIIEKKNINRFNMYLLYSCIS